MSTDTERRNVLSRWRTGDYLCVSNDGETVWRFHSYEDGRVHGLEAPYNRRTFWRAVHMPLAAFNELGDMPSAWDCPPWVEADWYLPTRAAAVALMLKAGAK